MGDLISLNFYPAAQGPSWLVIFKIQNWSLGKCKARQGLEFSLWFKGRTLVVHCSFCLSVPPPLQTIEARGLKIDLHIPHMEGSKVASQIFDILPRSCEN